MPIEVELPDGNVVEFPDGTDNATMERALSQYRSGSPRADFSGVSTSVDTTARNPLALLSMGGPAASGVTAEQLAQENSARRATFDPVAARAAELSNRQQAFNQAPLIGQFASGAGSRVASAAMGLGQLLGLTDEQDAQRQADQMAFMDGNSAASVGKVAGDIGLLAAPGGAIGKIPSIGGRIAGNAALGAGYGALDPVTGDESRLENAAIGGAAGGIGGAAQSALGALAGRARAAVDPIRQRAIEVAREQGIPLHISQLSQSIPLKTMASVAKYLPFSGAGEAASRQQGAFNRAVGRTFGADTPQFTDEAMAAARKGMSGRFQEIYDRNNIPVDEAVAARLASRQSQVSEPLLKEEAAVVERYAQKIRDEVADGKITGPIYQRLRTNLMEAEKRANPGVAAAIKGLRGELDEIAAEAVGEADSAALKALRSQWANFRTTENVLRQVAGAGGDVRPAALWPAIRSGSTKEMRELARTGQVLLKDPIPDSGTSGRLLAGGLLGGGGFVGGAESILPLAGLLAGGATAGRVLNSGLLAGAVANPGRGALALSRAAPAGTILVAPAVVPKAKRRRADD
ncbi:hypothetical protein [Stenotrophomonas maltophilia]|uniref:hypothetical protein n=1 Tax=Stenotrophomonas maltophilia TaxID=40324 RepID=UPI00192E3536|nr:hypothetical protein [Stenotrophomonas maltophilia]